MNSSPIDVTVVRPKVTGATALGRLAGRNAVLFLTAWLVMLIVGAQTPWHPGYWQVFLLLVAIRLILPAASDSTYTYWTKEPK
ncbi:hypothetical protein [Prescottella agglutinans]|uniref:hypothetical protein n=1 Tax=Prescottella agglutinans TaxID=1644129 RepID=UPI002474F271|nr:hypothetical protein [Prescottella agglutinans]